MAHYFTAARTHHQLPEFPPKNESLYFLFNLPFWVRNSWEIPFQVINSARENPNQARAGSEIKLADSREGLDTKMEVFVIFRRGGERWEGFSVGSGRGARPHINRLPTHGLVGRRPPWSDYFENIKEKGGGPH